MPVCAGQQLHMHVSISQQVRRDFVASAFVCAHRGKHNRTLLCAEFKDGGRAGVFVTLKDLLRAYSHTQKQSANSSQN